MLKLNESAKMNKIFLALGSNIGDKEHQLNEAIRSLGEKLTDIKTASYYTTSPMYYTDQPDFLNTVISGLTGLLPLELLEFTQHIQSKLGRQKRFKNAPREIDIDILFYGNMVYVNKDLIIPHPLIHERQFVLKPFMELDPEFMHPVLKKTIRQLLQASED